MSGNDLKLQVLLQAIDRATGPFKRITAGSNATAKALRVSRDRLRDLDRAQQQLQGFRKFSAQVSDSGIAMKAAYQKIAQLKAEINGVENPTQKAARAFAKAEREAVKLKNAHIANLRALKESKAALAGAGMSINQLGDHERRLRNEITQTNALIDKQQQKLGRLSAQNQRMYLAQRNLARSRSMAGAAASGGVSLTTAGAVALAPVAASVKAYANFEDAMLGVARQVQGARDGTGKLTPLYFQMGDAIKALSERIPMATTEIAALIEAGARMGIQGKENLLAFAETTAITATAFDLPVDQVGENMGKLAGLYKIPIKNIAELGDTINWLDDNALSKGGDIIDVMQRLGGVADKLDFRKAAALGSTFLSLGAAPEVAASASNAMVRELSIATMQRKRFQTGLERLGMKAQAVQDAMSTDATGTILKVLDAIKQLPKNEQLTVATQLFGKEFGDDASKLANNLAAYRKQLALVDAAQAKGSMSKEAQARLQNLSAGWQLVKNQAFNTASQLGSTLAPALLSTMKAAGGVIDKIGNWVKANPKLASGLLKAAAVIGVLLTALGGAALAIGGIIGPLALVKFSMVTLGLKFGPVLGLLKSFGKLFMWLGRLMLTNPIGLVLTAMAVAAYLIWKNWGTIGPALAGIWESITINVGLAWDWLKAKAGVLWEGLKVIFAWSPLGLIMTHWNAILGFLGGLWDRFKAIGGNLLQGLIKGLLGGLTAVRDTITGIGGNVVDWMKAKLGIHSPSRVFAQVGHFTMAGLAGGLDRSQQLPMRALMQVAGNMRRLGAGIAIGAAAAPAMAIDNRAPVSPAMTASGGVGATYNITIHATPGSPAQDIAQLVRAELERIERERSARKRSRLGDYD